MPRLALVSDTHLPRFGRRLPAALMEALEAARPDVILHLGDHTAASVVDELAAIAPVEAVAGNNDPPELVARYGLRRVLEAGIVRIGLTHGHLGHGSTTPGRALATFAAEGVHIVAFGHSHIPLVVWRGATLLINPGSPTDRRRQPCPTLALLEVTAGAEPMARIVPLSLPQPERPRRCSTV